MDNLKQYERSLRISNLESLPAGTGCKYLVCIITPDNSGLIAKRWARKIPKTGLGEVVVWFE